MTRAKHGDTVKVHYTGRLEDGVLFDTSAEREPLQVTIGEGHVIPGFEQALQGMAPGEKKSTTIPPEQAYGPYREEMTAVLEREKLPQDVDLSVGQRLSVPQQDGRKLVVTVTDVSDSAVRIDANHRLAGRSLVFDLELVEIM